jgi:tripartite-type tricarboxylate transporter receptor subunit TctC
VKRIHVQFLVVALLVCGVAASFASAQQTFPTRAITIIVPWSAGGGTDVLARALARSGQEHLGVPVVVENRPGGSGAVGLGEVLTARPDGYTLAILPVELAFLSQTGIYPFSFDNFTKIMNLNTDPAALTVKAGRFQDVDEFISYARANPGALKVGHSGTGLLWHLAAGTLALEADIDLVYVPFDGAAPAQAALIGGHIDAITVSGAEVSAQVRAGELQILAMMGESRLEIFPDVPTLRELGIDVNINTFRGLGGPRDIPADRVAILHDAFKKMMEEPEFISTLENMGLGIDYRSTADYEILATETAQALEPTVRALGLFR